MNCLRTVGLARPSKGLGLLVLAGLLGAAMACTSLFPDPTVRLTAARDTITLGESTTLLPDFPGHAGGAKIDHDIGTVHSGIPVTVSPTEDTTYELSFYPAIGVYHAYATVHVVSAPAITGFSSGADLGLVSSGTATTLTAVFTGGTGSIDQGIGPVQSGVPVSTGNLTADTTFTLTVTSAAGAVATQSVTVTVSAAPVTPVLAVPAYVTAGATGLAASVSNAASEPAGTTYAWTLTNGTIQGAATGSSISFTAGASGTVAFRCVASNPAHAASAPGTASATIVGTPSAPVLSVPAKVTANVAGLAASVSNAASLPAGSSFAWTITSGGTIQGAATGSSITFTAGASGTVAFRCVVTTLAGVASTGTASSAIVAAPVTPVLSAPAFVTGNATGLAASVTNTAAEPAGTIYTWTSPNGGATITGGNGTSSITFNAAASGTASFSCTATNFAGGSTSAPGTASSGIVAAPGTPALAAPLYVTANATGLTASVTNVASLPAGTTFAWSAINGTITPPATGSSITFSAGASGTVAFTCVATNLGGTPATGTTSSTIVAPAVVPALSAPAHVTASTAGYSASVTNTGVQPATVVYAWGITNGTIQGSTTGTSVSFTSLASGTVALTCTATNFPGGTTTAAGNASSAIVAAAVVPVLSAPAHVTASTAGYTASVTNTGVQPVGVVYGWGITNGSIQGSTTGASVSFTAGPSGTVSFTCTATNFAGGATTAAGATSSAIVAAPAVPAVTAPAQVTASTAGYSATMSNTGSQPVGVSYAWSISNGSIQGSTSGTSVSFTAGASGTVTVSCTATNFAGGTTSAAGSDTSAIVAAPAVPAVTVPAKVTAGTAGYTAGMSNTGSQPVGVSYAWSIANGSIQGSTSGTSVSFTPGASGTVTVSCTATNFVGGVTTIAGNGSSTIVAAPAVPAVTAPAQVTAGIAGYTAGMTNTGSQPVGVSYAWSISNGSIQGSTSGTSVSFTPGASGTVTVSCTATNFVGGTTSAAGSDTSIIVAAPAVPAVTAPTQVTAGTAGYTATMSNTGSQPVGVSYAWSIANGSIQGSTSGISVSFTAGASGTVTVSCTATNFVGGTTSAAGSDTSAIVAAPAVPTVTVPAQVTAGIAGYTAGMSNTGSQPVGVSYAWSISNGTIQGSTSGTSVSFTPGASGTVTVSCTATNFVGGVTTTPGSDSSAIVAAPVNPALNGPTFGFVTQGLQDTVNVTNTGAEPFGSTYTWSITDGSIIGANGTTTSTTLTFVPGPLADTGLWSLTCTVTNFSPGGTSASTTLNFSLGNPALMSLSVSDGSAEDWATIGVRILGVGLIPQGGSAASAVPVYTAPVPAPTVNLVALDQLGELLGQLPVPPGTYTGAVLTLGGNPGDVTLVAGADPSAGFPDSAATAVPAERIQIQGAAGPAGERTVPVSVTFASSLVQAAGQPSALDLEFDLSHPAFLVDHRAAADAAPVWAVTFDGTVRHRAAAGPSLVLRHLYGTGATVAGTPGRLAITKLFAAGATAQAASQRLHLVADAAQGTRIQDLDAGTSSTLADFAGAAGTFAGRYLRIAARAQADGTLCAARIWVSSSFARVVAGAEGHVLHLNAATGILTVEDATGSRVPVQVTPATRFYLRNPGDAQADATPIGTGTGALGSLLVRGFKVHASLDASTTPATALAVEIETAKFDGALTPRGGQGLTFVRRFATPGDGYTVNLGYSRAAAQVAAASGTGVADAGGVIVAPEGVGYATWNDPAAPAAWSAKAAALKPSTLPKATLASNWTGSGFRLNLPGAADSLAVDLGAGAQAYQVDQTGGVVTVTPVDLAATAGQAWLADHLVTGATVRVFGVPQADGHLQASVLLLYTGRLPL